MSTDGEGSRAELPRRRPTAAVEDKGSEGRNQQSGLCGRRRVSAPKTELVCKVFI